MRYLYKSLILILVSILITSCFMLPSLPHITPVGTNYFQISTIKPIIAGIENLIIFWAGTSLICSMIICLLTQYIGNKIPLKIGKPFISCLLCFTILYFGMKWVMGADPLPDLLFCLLVFITSNSGWSWLINDLKLQNHISTFLTDKKE